ncbi:MAG TPA: hypothetical protein VFS67_10985 [Polyangiaceae bacterium]|nr:hypothetical protein [Polyangiaceae bacterium]
MSSPRIEAVERWLEGLSPGLQSPDSAGDAEPVLFILDNDFGELTTVLSLLLGQRCFRGARLLLPPRLYEQNREALPGQVALWTSEQELVEAISRLQPRVLVLASGYLLPVHGLLSVDALGRVLEAARRQRALVLTADPFLGLISQWASQGLEQLISIDIPASADARLLAAKRGADALLHRELGAVERLLRPLPHLYPSYPDLAALTPAVTDGRNVGFFNPALLLPPELSAPSEAAPHWMFVLSLVDFQTQVMFHGPVRFAGIVRRLLTRATELGRRAILLAPDALCQLLRPLLPESEPIQLLSFCAFRRALSLLLTAEHCFYWNVVSHTILMQLANGRPPILLDRGHLARAVPEIAPRVIAWYYQGWAPPYLDPEAELSLELLAERKSAHAGPHAELLQRLRRAPEPEELLRSWLAQAEGTPGARAQLPSPALSSSAG